MDIIQFLENLIRKKDGRFVLYEFGAHHGEHTEIFLSLLKGKDFFFKTLEADRRNIQVLKTKFDKYVAPFAIGDVDGEVEFFFSEKESGKWDWSSSLVRPKDHLRRHPTIKFNKQSARSIRFDTLVERDGVDVIDFVWADIQGAENKMILGGQKAFAKTRYLYTEYDDNENYQGQWGLDEIIENLPGEWVIVEKYKHDVLLKNKTIE